MSVSLEETIAKLDEAHKRGLRGICGIKISHILKLLRELQERRKQINSCKGCKWLRLPNSCANDKCARMYKDRYEAERKTDG